MTQLAAGTPPPPRPPTLQPSWAPMPPTPPTPPPQRGSLPGVIGAAAATPAPTASTAEWEAARPHRADAAAPGACSGVVRGPHAASPGLCGVPEAGGLLPREPSWLAVYLCERGGEGRESK
eukprot:282114-Chlamydomonas_euryale.AAC.1